MFKDILYFFKNKGRENLVVNLMDGDKGDIINWNRGDGVLYFYFL